MLSTRLMPSFRADITECTHVYPPSEDSDLLLDAMEINSGETVLDMGTGSGILAVNAAICGGIVTAADISKKAVECTRLNAESNNVKIRAIRSDLFGRVEGTYDVIIFNPPYLPGESWSREGKGDRSWDGGGDGSETITRFLGDLPGHLEGRCYLLFSSLTGKGKDTIKELVEKRFHFKEMASKELFFETLHVYELRLK